MAARLAGASTGGVGVWRRLLQLGAPAHVVRGLAIQADPAVHELTITENCAKYVNHYAQLRATEFASSLPFLRVGIKTGGCGLFEYDIKLDAELADDDIVFEKNGAKIVVDEMSFERLKGSLIDYEVKRGRENFVVAFNPNSASSCGCGSSFTPKDM